MRIGRHYHRRRPRRALRAGSRCELACRAPRPRERALRDRARRPGREDGVLRARREVGCHHRGRHAHERLVRRRHGRLHRRDGCAFEGACRTVRRARRARAIGPPGIGPLRRLREDRHPAPAQPGSFEGGPSAVVVSCHREADDRRLGAGPRHPSARHLRGRPANLQPDACARVRRAPGACRRRHRDPPKPGDHRRLGCCPRSRRAVRG